MPGFVIGIVQDTSNMTKKSWMFGKVMLDFADCHRRVSFDFDMSDTVIRRESLRKINLIAEVVNAVRDAIEKEVASIDARPGQVNDSPKEMVAISNSAK